MYDFFLCGGTTTMASCPSFTFEIGLFERTDQWASCFFFVLVWWRRKTTKCSWKSTAGPSWTNRVCTSTRWIFMSIVARPSSKVVICLRNRRRRIIGPCFSFSRTGVKETNSLVGQCTWRSILDVTKTQQSWPRWAPSTLTKTSANCIGTARSHLQQT